MKRVLGALAAGVLFGVGLVIAGMTQPAKVVGFLDFAGDWDPSLAFVMSAVTTILGVLPLIVFHDPLFYSMACIIAFGLALGTVLSLLVVPVIYSFFFNVKESLGSPVVPEGTGSPETSAVSGP